MNPTPDQPSGLRNPWIIPRYDPMPCKCPRCPAPPLMERSAVGLWVAIDDHVKEVNTLRARAEQAEREVVYWKGLVHDEETRRAMAGPLACNHEQARHRADHAIRIYEAEFAKLHAQLQAVAQYRTAALARAGEVKP